jgi:hypothetical protein
MKDVTDVGSWSPYATASGRNKRPTLTAVRRDLRGEVPRMVKVQALARQKRCSEDTVMPNICRLPETPGGWDELAGPSEEETPLSCAVRAA